MKKYNFLIVAVILLYVSPIHAQFDSSVGDFAQIIHYVASSMQCATRTWQTFRNDGNRKANGILYNLEFFYRDLNESYSNFNKNYSYLGYRKKPIDDYLSYVQRLAEYSKTYFRNLQLEIKKADNKFNETIDRLTRRAYHNSIESIKISFKLNKPCISNIMAEFRNMFDILVKSLSKCSDQTINIYVIDSDLSNGFAFGSKKLLQIQDCIKVNLNSSQTQYCKNQALNCINKVINGLKPNTGKIRESFENGNIKMQQITFRFPAYINACINQVDYDINVQITKLIAVSKECEIYIPTTTTKPWWFPKSISTIKP